MALNQIPYTNVHELNLDWILQKVQEFDNKITEFQETIDTFAEYVSELEEILPRISALESEYSALRSTVTNLQSDISSIHNSISALESALNIEKSARASADNDLQRQINEIIDSMVNVASLERKIKIYVDQKVRASDQRTDSKILAVNLQINTYYLELLGYIEEIREALEHVATDVFNAAAYNYANDGRIGFDLNNKLLYLHCTNSISAEEYAGLGLTADQYSAYNINAYRYLLYSPKELHTNYVFMPISGVRQEISVAMTEIVNALYNTISATEYSSLDLDSDAYVALDLTASEYRRLNSSGEITNGIRYSSSGTGITADQYSHLKLTD